MECDFIESILDCGGLDGSPTGALLSPRVNVVEVVVEGITVGPILGDCLLGFFRQVFEEIDAAKKNRYLLCSNCRVVEGQMI